MPFIGLQKDTLERIDITKLENPRLTLKSGECICQLCKAPLIVKAGNIYRAHFAHYGERECSTDYKYHPESPEHRNSKVLLAGYLKRAYAEYSSAEIEYEVPVPEIKRVADILITFPMGWRIAHEIQLAKISESELQERTDDYYKAGIDVVWWLGRSANTSINRDWCIKTFGYCVTLNLEEKMDTVNRSIP